MASELTFLVSFHRNGNVSSIKLGDEKECILPAVAITEDGALALATRESTVIYKDCYCKIPHDLTHQKPCEKREPADSGNTKIFRGMEATVRKEVVKFTENVSKEGIGSCEFKPVGQKSGVECKAGLLAVAMQDHDCDRTPDHVTIISLMLDHDSHALVGAIIMNNYPISAMAPDIQSKLIRPYQEFVQQVNNSDYHANVCGDWFRF